MIRLLGDGTANPVGDSLLGTDQVCEIVGVKSPRTLRFLIESGQFPPADRHVGKFKKWKASTILEYVNSGGNGAPLG